jgi:hypothetical protein
MTKKNNNNVDDSSDYDTDGTYDDNTKTNDESDDDYDEYDRVKQVNEMTRPSSLSDRMPLLPPIITAAMAKTGMIHCHSQAHTHTRTRSHIYT